MKRFQNPSWWLGWGRTLCGLVAGAMAVVVAFRPVAVAEGRSLTPTAGVAVEQLQPGEVRTFAIEYRAQVGPVPEGAERLRVWLPVPTDSPAQSIRELGFSRPVELTRDAVTGNRYAYWEVARPRGGEEVVMRFVCERREVRTAGGGVGADELGGVEAQFAQYTRPAGLVVVDDEVRAIAAAVTAGRRGVREKARAIYEHVVDTMTYDKSRPGWGTGSTRFACEARRGNCTDFHALFMSLCRAEGIATEFEIGLYLPYERGSDAAVGAYHCWAYFRVPGEGWVPVDTSEATLQAARRDYFFGNHTANRVALSQGRDLVLVPAQDGGPVNFLIEPYAEVDGKPVAARKTWSFVEAEPAEGETVL